MPRIWGSIFDDNFATDPLFEEHLFVLAALDSPWARRRRIELAELLDEPWTMPELDTVVGALIVEGFRSAGVALPMPRIVSNLSERDWWQPAVFLRCFRARSCILAPSDCG